MVVFSIRKHLEKPMSATWREKQKAELHQHIYTISLQLFRSRGYEGTSVDAIVKQAGIAKGTFFNYFKSKEYVILEWYRHLMTDTLDWAKSQEYKSAKHAILLPIEEMARRADAEPELIAAKVSSTYSSPLLGNEEKQFDDQMLSYFEQHIELGQQQGEIAPQYDSGLMASTILATISGTGYEWKSLGRSFNLRETTQLRVSFIIDATGV
jgi:TetR/AcrR family fatty acid metabolism transcriptional regulator